MIAESKKFSRCQLFCSWDSWAWPWAAEWLLVIGERWTSSPLWAPSSVSKFLFNMLWNLNCLCNLRWSWYSTWSGRRQLRICNTAPIPLPIPLRAAFQLASGCNDRICVNKTLYLEIPWPSSSLGALLRPLQLCHDRSRERSRWS